MNRTLLALALVILLAAPSATAEPTDADATAACVHEVAVTSDAQWLHVLPERPPPTSTRLSFDDPSGGHVEVNWDPYDARGLARIVLLTKGTWQVSFWAEPQRDSMAFANNYAWQSRSERCAAAWGTADTVIVEERRTAGQPGHVKIKMTDAGKPALLEGIDSSRLPGAASALATLRSFDVASVPTQAAELVVRVVTRAVRKKALRLASDKLQAIVCKRPAKDEPPYLARTCEAVRGIDLATLSTAARPIAAALTQDLTQLALAKLDLPAPDAIVEAVATGFALLHTRPDLSPADVQQVLLAAATDYLERDVDGAGVLAAQVALRVVAYCRDAGACEATLVRALLKKPSTYFSLPASAGPFLATYEATVKLRIADVERLVAEGRRVFETARTVTGADRLRAAIRTNLRLVAVAACFADAARCGAAARLVELAEHATQGDLRSMLGVVTRAATDVLSARQQRRLSLFLAMVEQAAAVATGSPDERKLASEQVEAAMDAVLDDAVDRHGRDEEWIFSLGTGLRLHGAYKFSGTELRGPVSVPVALSVDRLCGPDADDRWCLLAGWHFELGFLDVGNYLRIYEEPAGAGGGDDEVSSEPVAWTDIANLSVGVGWMFGSVDWPMYFGITGGLAPGAQGAQGGRGWNGYAGAYVGAYFPVLDFN